MQSLLWGLALFFTGLVQWIGSRLLDEQGATARSSTLYTNLVTNGYPPAAYERGGRCVFQKIHVTLVSAAATGDTYKLFKLRKGETIALIHLTTDGIAASAGVGATVKIGDSGDDDRYMPATDFDAAAAQFCGLAFAGVDYQAESDRDVVMTITGANVAGKIVKGCAIIVPAS